MAKEETVMYSINSKTGDPVLHRFPYNRDTKEGAEFLAKYQAKGFTFEPPKKKAEIVHDAEDITIADVPTTLTCPICQKECKGQFGLKMHMSVHEGEKKKP